MTPDDIAPEFRSSAKSYEKAAPIEGVRTIRLPRFTDDRGFFLELFRARANHAGGSELAKFFEGVPVVQVNYSIVDVGAHIKGLHYHLKQEGLWFFPPPFQAKVVSTTCASDSPSFGRTQAIVAGGGQDLLVADSSGRRARLPPPHEPLLTAVTRDRATFDPAAPD